MLKNVFNRKYKCVMQHDSSDCGAAVLATVALSYKSSYTIATLRDIIGTDINGTSVYGIVSGAKKIGFQAEAVMVSGDDVFSDYTLPAVAHITNDYGMDHFIVIHKIKKDTIVIADPEKGIDEIDKEDFLDSFNGVIIVLLPTLDFKVYKGKSNSIFRVFYKLIAAQKNLIVPVILSSLVLTILGVLMSIFSKILIDEIIPYNLRKELVIYAIVFSIIVISQAVLGAFRTHIVLYLSRKIDIPIMIGYYKHILKLPISFFSTRKIGDILTRFQDADQIKEIFSGMAVSLVLDIMLASITGVVLFRMNNKLFMIVIVGVVLQSILIYVFKKPYKDINYKQMESEAILNSHLIESVKNVNAIKINCCDEEQINLLEEKFIDLQKNAYREGVLQNIQSTLSGVFSGLSGLIYMVVGAMIIMDSKMTLGDLIAFQTLSQYFTQPIQNLISLQLTFQEANISMKRLSEILEVEPEVDDTKEYIENITLKGDIVFDNVTFRYGLRSNVLEHISFKIEKNSTVAIVGESGSGKSTIAKLILGLYTPINGNIYFGEYDVKYIHPKKLRDNIGYVTQEAELFTGRLIENIRMWNSEIKYEDVVGAAKQVGAHEFIEKIPGGYHSFLEEDGNNLSGGEKQRILIARALVKKPTTIIYDESTSNLDSFSERKIHSIMHSGKDITTIIIAHRLSTIIQCDKIIYIEDGKVLGEGTHSELLKRLPKYKEMIEFQSGDLYTQNNGLNLSENNSDLITY